MPPTQRPLAAPASAPAPSRGVARARPPQGAPRSPPGAVAPPAKDSRSRRTAAAIGRANRNKGKVHEREVAEAFRALWPGAKRGIGQARSGGEIPDVVGTPFWIEARQRKEEPLRAWVEQAHAEAKGRKPALVVSRRFGESENIIAMRLDDFIQLLADMR